MDARKREMIAAHFPALRERAAQLGLPMAERHPPLGVDTRAAHEAAKLVAREAPARAREFQRAAFRTHWLDGGDLADRATLDRLVEAVGVDPALLDGERDRLRAAVLADENEARERGVRAVPQLFLDGEALPPGMPTIEALRGVATQVLARGGEQRR